MPRVGESGWLPADHGSPINTLMNLVLWGVLGYVLLQLAVGILVSRKIRTESDYLVAGRRIGLPLAVFSMFATWFGAETCIGAAGLFYADGLSGGTTDPFGYALALFLVGWFLARPLWNRGLTTLADLFRQRYGPSTERLAALVMVPTSVFWAAAQIRAFGIVLHATTGIEVTTAVLVATGVVIVYTCTGGLLADVITDFIQGVAIIVGLGALLVFLALAPDIDLSHAWNQVPAERLQLFASETNVWEQVDLWLTLLLGSVVAQEIAARVLGTKSAATAVRATHLGGLLYLTVGLIPAFLGLVGPSILPNLTDPETFLPRLAENYLPPVIFVLFTGAIVSAILSTVDSTLLAAASLSAHNVVVSFRPGMSEAARLRLARGGVAVFGLVACGMALGADSIFELVQQANGLGSAGICVLVAGGLYGGSFGGPRTGIATLVAGLGTWTWGTYIGDWSATYLVSLAAATSTFALVGLAERRGGTSAGAV